MPNSYNIAILGGLTPYLTALEYQKRIVERLRADPARGVGTLFVLEHPPVITLGRSADDNDVVASPQLLGNLGIEVHRVERGGQVTYHGPGQIVVYPVFRLGSLNLGVKQFVHALEETMIRALARFGITAKRREKIIGVWTERGKIGAVGIRVTRGISFHGFALNANPDLKAYEFIVPCGMKEGAVTSIAKETGVVPQREIVEQTLIDAFKDVLDEQ